MKANRRRRLSSGASLIEVIAGLIILIPLFLCILDLSAIIIGQIVNDGLAKRAARAAAQQAQQANAQSAANAVISAYPTNGIVSSATLYSMQFNQSNSGNVVIETRVKINVPAPVPYVPMFQNGRFMHARATEPIVMLPAPP